VLGAGLGLAHTAKAGAVVKVVVLMERGVGTPSAAQPYLNQFMGTAGQLNGWDPASSGMYFTNRPQAEAWIKSDSPYFGIFTLPAFLALRRNLKLDVIGEAKTNTGGEQYFIASLKQASLADCKGKTLATDHLQTPDDEKFIEKVVAAGAFTKADFTVVPTTRFLQANSHLSNGNAECVLIHDAQLAALQKSNSSAKVVWSSAKLPGLAVVAFPNAPAAEKAAFQASLPKICQGNNQSVCSAVTLLALNSASQATYQTVINAYP
jgi:hypothetical protein